MKAFENEVREALSRGMELEVWIREKEPREPVEEAVTKGRFRKGKARGKAPRGQAEEVMMVSRSKTKPDAKVTKVHIDLTKKQDDEAAKIKAIELESA